MRVHMHARHMDKMGRFMRLLQSDTEKEKQETVQTWKQHKRTAITTHPDPTVVSIHITTAPLPRQTGHLPTGTTYLAIANCSYFSHRCRQHTRRVWWQPLRQQTHEPNPVDFESETLHRASELKRTVTTCVLTALDSACLQISHLPFSGHSWLELFPRNLQHF